MGGETILSRQLSHINNRLIELCVEATKNHDLALAVKLLKFTTNLSMLMTDMVLDNVRTTNDAHQRLLALNEQLTQVCAQLDGESDAATVYKLLAIADDLTRLVVELSVRRN